MPARYKFRRFLIRTLRWLFSSVLIEILAFLLISPFVLGYLCVLNKLHCIDPLFKGDIILLWITSSVILFVPMLISVITSTVKKEKEAKLQKKQDNTKA